jgi:hypothetical protein
MIRHLAWLLAFVVLIGIGPAAADETDGLPMVRVDLEPVEATIGQAVTMRITVLVPTWFPNPPVWPSLDTTNAIVRLPPDSSRSVSERIGAATWSGVTRKYLVFPQVPGNLSFSGKAIELSYADPETRETIVTQVDLPEIVIEVIVPEGAEDLVPYLAGQAVSLEQKIEGTTDDLRPGDAIVRTVTASIEGMPAMFLPQLIEPNEVSGLDQLAASPTLEDEVGDASAVTGTRVESVTYVVEADGTYRLPEVSLSWWDMSSAEVRTEVLEEIVLHASGGLLDGVASNGEGRDFLSPGLILSVLIAGMVCVLLWLFRERLRGLIADIRERRRMSEHYAYGELRKAISSGDLGRIDACWLTWSARIGARSAMPRTMSGLMAMRYGAGAAGTEVTSEARASLMRELRELRRTSVRRSRHGRSDLPATLNP